MKNRLGTFLVVAVVGAFMVATGTAMAADTIKLGVAGASQWRPCLLWYSDHQGR
jgi:hypothetical protein